MSELIGQHPGVQQLAPAAEIAPIQAFTEATSGKAGTIDSSVSWRWYRETLFAVFDKALFTSSRVNNQGERLKRSKAKKGSSGSSRWRTCARCINGEGGLCDCRTGIIMQTYLMPYVSLGLSPVTI